jgi:hypothetical protein
MKEKEDEESRFWNYARIVVNQHQHSGVWRFTIAATNHAKALNQQPMEQPNLSRRQHREPRWK